MSFPLSALLRYSARQRAAAKQMWAVVQSGILFEIPASLSTDDDTLKALMLMCEQHPETMTAERRANGTQGSPLVLQARGIVVGLRSAMQISPNAANVLNSYGYMPDAIGGLTALIQKQEAFIRNHGGLEPEEAVKQGQMEAAERNKIVLPEQAKDRADEVVVSPSAPEVA